MVVCPLTTNKNKNFKLHVPQIKIDMTLTSWLEKPVQRIAKVMISYQ